MGLVHLIDFAIFSSLTTVILLCNLVNSKILTAGETSNKIATKEGSKVMAKREAVDFTTTGENIEATTETSHPYSLLYEHCGFIRNLECNPDLNLVCSDLIPTQWSTCICKPQMVPHPLGNRFCVPPKKIIRIGDKCRPEAREFEEACASELAYCSPNGTCICGDDGYGQVLYDEVHRDCYLKTHPRSHIREMGGKGITKPSSLCYLLILIHYTSEWIKLK